MVLRMEYPKLPDIPGDEFATDEPIWEVFTRVFYKQRHRLAAGHPSSLFWELVDLSDRGNIVRTDIAELSKRMELGSSSVYNILNELRAANAVVQVKRNVWMIDPSLVFRGPSRYHRMTRMQYGIALDKQRREFQLRAKKRQKGDDDEQCDLQARSGDPDPAIDALGAERTRTHC